MGTLPDLTCQHAASSATGTQLVCNIHTHELLGKRPHQVWQRMLPAHESISPNRQATRSSVTFGYQERDRTHSFVPLRTSSLYTLGVFILCESEVREGSLVYAGVLLPQVCSTRASDVRARRCRARERVPGPAPNDLSSCSFLGVEVKLITQM